MFLIGLAALSSTCTGPTSIPTPTLEPSPTFQATRPGSRTPAPAESSPQSTSQSYLPLVSGSQHETATQKAALVEEPTGTPLPSPTETPTTTPTAPPTPINAGSIPTPILVADRVRFAVIGDYGTNKDNERKVADLVKNWQPDFIITTGDNNYPDGSADTIDVNIGHYYFEYISPYLGGYGAGSAINRFFPTLGAHDWQTTGAEPYLDYFSLPGNERYYEFIWGPVHFYALDSDLHEPDGVKSDSYQAAWLRATLQRSSSCWDLVYFHQPPYTSGAGGDTAWMQWPFQEWGANAVISGRDHIYERISADDFPYFVVGLGGDETDDFKKTTPGSQVRYNTNYGALFVTATPITMVYEFFNIQGKLIDQFTQSGCK
ncbi:MAG TPA: metallophosphoesterase [Anaerolineaceae bacterium]|nr:metallophosphoesterase [Anaerolineaceae bacterium]